MQKAEGNLQYGVIKEGEGSAKGKYIMQFYDGEAVDTSQNYEFMGDPNFWSLNIAEDEIREEYQKDKKRALFSIEA